MDTETTGFSKRLRIARESKHLTQQELADMMGVDRTTYLGWEKGKGGPSRDQYPSLCMHLGVSADHLLGVGEKQEAVVMGKPDDPLALLSRALKLLEEREATERFRIEQREETERIRIREVEALAVQAALRAQENVQRVIESREGGREGSEGIPQGPAAAFDAV